MAMQGYPEIGDRFGRWTVVDPDAGRRGEHGRRVACRCGCGTLKTFRLDKLRAGRSKQCGDCLKESRRRARDAKAAMAKPRPPRPPLRPQAGERSGRWLVINPAAGKSNAGARLVLCVCDCGSERLLTARTIRQGQSRSCGCDVSRPGSKPQLGPTRHEPTYNSWKLAISRTEDPNDDNYPNYGAKGIKMCAKWRRSFAKFFAYMGPRPPGTTLDRWPDKKGDYEEGNSRWATVKQQNNNKTNNRLVTLGSTTLTLSEWSDLTGVNRCTIQSRLDAGWSTETALSYPPSLDHLLDTIRNEP